MSSRRRSCLVGLGLALAGLALPAGADPARELLVFAAASLRESFDGPGGQLRAQATPA